jgi:hypothetical protein
VKDGFKLCGGISGDPHPDFDIRLEAVVCQVGRGHERVARVCHQYLGVQGCELIALSLGPGEDGRRLPTDRPSTEQCFPVPGIPMKDRGDDDAATRSPTHCSDCLSCESREFGVHRDAVANHEERSRRAVDNLPSHGPGGANCGLERSGMRPGDLHLWRGDQRLARRGSRTSELVDDLTRGTVAPRQHHLTKTVCAGAVDRELVLQGRDRRREPDPSMFEGSLKAVQQVIRLPDD